MRLIDADALLQDLKLTKKDLQEIREGLKRDDEKRICDSEIVTFGECIMRVNNAPTVDIKTEVAREIFADIKQGLEELSNIHRENSDYSGVVHTIQARSIVVKLENKYTKEGVGE